MLTKLKRPVFVPMEITPRLPAEVVPLPVEVEEEKEAPDLTSVVPMPTLPSPVDPLADDFQPTMLTFEQVCHWLSMNPGVRKFFVNTRGEFVRKWIEEYDWMTRPGGGIIKIPTWFGPEVMNPKTGIISPYEPATQGSADRI